MAQHNALGKAGEEAAANYLLQKGYRICHRNWHSGRKELDIVAEKDDTIVIIEVKTRRNDTFGQPEVAVDTAKIRHIIASTEAYLCQFGIDLPVRFDIISVTGTEHPFHIEHIEEAFLPPVW